MRARYGGRLTAAETESLREGVRTIVDNAVALRRVRLDNADEPAQPFRPFRAEP